MRSSRQLLRLAGRSLAAASETAAQRAAPAVQQSWGGLGAALSRPSEVGLAPALWRSAAAATSLRGFSALPPHTELSMPALSPTMSQGNLVSWHVKEGQAVAPGDVLADVETDKATLSWENQDEGFVAKLLIPAGTQNVEVGTPVALLVDEEDQLAAFKDYQPGAAGAAAAAAPAAAAEDEAEEKAAGTAAPGGAHHSDRMGPAARTLLAESGISPDLVTPTGPNGIITKGDVLAAIAAGVKPGAAAAPKKQKRKQPTKKEAAAAAAAPATAQATVAAPAAPAAAAPKAAPAAAPAAAAPQQAAAAPAAAAPRPAAGAAYTDIPNSQIRKIIAQRLLESKQSIPHLYLSADVDLDGVSGLREALKQQGTKVSVNDCVIKAVALALAEVPAANAYWDVAQESVVPASSVDISIAVATDTGLITPIIRGADKKALLQIAAEVRELASRARANKLKPEEFQGGSFSISNLGMFGVDKFFAIINPPQACIMAVGGARRVAAMRDGQPASKSQMTVTLSADNRVYDGEVAGAFLEAFSRHMGQPYRLFQ